MRNTAFCFLGAVLFVLSLSNEAHSQSERWLYLGEIDDTEIYLDTETIIYNEHLNAYEIYTRIQLPDNSHHIDLINIFCYSKTMKVLYVSKYNKSGILIYDTRVYFPIEMDIIPESNPEKVFNYLCK